MSTSPQDMQQMLAMYKAFYGNPQLQGMNQVQQSLGAGAPAGTNRTAGGVNGAAQLIAALMKAQKQKQLQQQLQNQQQGMSPQGVSLSTPSDPSPSGMGVPGGP